jgi:hypothetical protein
VSRLCVEPRRSRAHTHAAAPQAGVANLPTWSEAGKADYFADPVTLFLIQARALASGFLPAVAALRARSLSLRH